MDVCATKSLPTENKLCKSYPFRYKIPAVIMLKKQASFSDKPQFCCQPSAFKVGVELDSNFEF